MTKREKKIAKAIKKAFKLTRNYAFSYEVPVNQKEDFLETAQMLYDLHFASVSLFNDK